MVDLTEIVTHIRGNKQTRDTVVKLIKRGSGPIIVEGMNFSLLEDRTIAHAIELALKKEKKDMTFILSNTYKNPKHIATLQKWGADVIILSSNKIDLSYLPPTYPQFWDDYILDPSQFHFLYPHDPTKKVHNHVGFVSCADVNEEILKRCYQAGNEILQKLPKKGYSARLNFIEPIVNDYYFVLNEKVLKQKYMGKWCIITRGTLFGKRCYNNYDEVTQIIDKMRKDSIFRYADKVFWRVGDETSYS